MRARQQYTREFREMVVGKILSRGSRTVDEVCREQGVLGSTAKNWLGRCGSDAGMKKSGKGWPAERKLKALAESSTMSESELGVYLRKEGLHEPRLTEWRADALKALGGAAGSRIRDDRDEKIKGLEHEILRKDRALAEASALLILQKKVHLIWARSEEEEK